MDSEKDLLFPAFQKFYSALSCLERFSKESSFFDNISCLDTFLSEFRNITFVTKKSLAHTSYMPLYDRALETYLTGLRWFIKKRDEVLKEKPFQLIKQIKITVYFPNRSFYIFDKSFSVDLDIKLSSLLNDIKIYLYVIHTKEVFFSASFSFFEKGKNEDLWDLLILGINSMRNFLLFLNEQIPGRCLQSTKIIKSVETGKMMHWSKDMFLINDYVYYPDKDEFEKVDRWGISTNACIGGKTIPRCSLDQWRSLWRNLGKNDFERFSAMHVSIERDLLQKHQDLMPAFMIVFDDDSYEIDAFNASNKTTLYRKINETAQQVLRENVKEIFFEYSMLSIADVPGVLNMTSKERQKLATEEWLVFLKIDNELNEEEYEFYVPGLKCPGYIKQQFLTGSSKELRRGKTNMQPIIEAFKKKKAINQNSAGNDQQ